MTRAMYNIVAQRPDMTYPSEQYPYGVFVVFPNNPFMFMIAEGQTSIAVKAPDSEHIDEFDTLYCIDAADITHSPSAVTAVSSLPTLVPLMGVYEVLQGTASNKFKLGLSMLPDYYKSPDNEFITQVTENTRIASDGLQFTENGLDISYENIEKALAGDYEDILGGN